MLTKEKVTHIEQIFIVVWFILPKGSMLNIKNKKLSNLIKSLVSERHNYFTPSVSPVISR